MTTTPTVWKAESIANAGATTGGQADPATIGLADGRFLVTWVDDTNNIDDDPGADIVGRIFDAQGNASGSAFQLNRTFFVDSEASPAIAVLPDGGFVVVYLDSGSTVGGDSDICFERFGAGGVYAGGGVVADGSIPTIRNYDPSIAVLANGDFVVTYQSTSAGDNDVIARFVSGTTGAVGVPLDAAENSADSDSNPDTVLLSNGNILTAYQEADGGVFGIQGHILTAAGGFAGSFLAAAAGTDPHVAALAGGGFVVVWENPNNNGNISAEVRDNAGVVVKSSFLVASGPNGQNEPEIVALKDGGFFVAWDDDTAAKLYGQRFDAAGNFIGTNVTIHNGDLAEQPELGLTDDGRILVTFVNDVEDIGQIILDPREKTIIGDNTSETITSRIDGASVNGLGGIDRLLGQGGADVLNGGTGADVLQGGGGNDVYYVDNAGDIVSDFGGGLETVMSSFSFSLGNAARVHGVVENLALLNVAAALNATGNNFANVLTGNNFANTMTGAVGNDVMRGFNGSDILIGGIGIDTLIGGLGNDFFVFNAPLNIAHRDVITDFFNVAGNNDTFRLENAVMTQLGAAGALAANKFFAGAAAHDADDRIVYNEASGALYYDSNGNLGGGVTLLALITNKPTLTSADFLVI